MNARIDCAEYNWPIAIDITKRNTRWGRRLSLVAHSTAPRRTLSSEQEVLVSRAHVADRVEVRLEGGRVARAHYRLANVVHVLVHLVLVRHDVLHDDLVRLPLGASSRRRRHVRQLLVILHRLLHHHALPVVHHEGRVLHLLMPSCIHIVRVVAPHLLS
ncbi:hypothetical protein PFISCL1PPCAC_4185, partial [Pristionchus fissidentatus]